MQIHDKEKPEIFTIIDIWPPGSMVQGSFLIRHWLSSYLQLKGELFTIISFMGVYSKIKLEMNRRLPLKKNNNITELLLTINGVMILNTFITQFLQMLILIYYSFEMALMP